MLFAGAGGGERKTAESSEMNRFSLNQNHAECMCQFPDELFCLKGGESTLGRDLFEGEYVVRFLGQEADTIAFLAVFIRKEKTADATKVAGLAGAVAAGTGVHFGSLHRAFVTAACR